MRRTACARRAAGWAVEPLEPRLQLAAGGFFVAAGDGLGANSVRHYGRAGVLLSTATFPAGDGGIRDLIADPAHRLQAFDGTATPALVSRIGRTFRQHTVAGWSVAGVTGAGGIAAVDQYVFVGDQRVGTDGPTDRGVIRFDAFDGYSAQRFATGLDVFDLSLGADGLLYALSGNAPTAAGLVTAFDPATMAVVRTLTPPGADHRAVAADCNGNVFVSSAATGQIFKLAPSGAVLRTATAAADDFDMSSDNVLLARTGTTATLFDVNLDVLDAFPIAVAPGGAAYVSWDTPQFPPTPHDVFGQVLDDSNDDGAADAPLADWRVYVDADGNGAFDAGEPSALTDADGQFTIEAVPPGTFKVRQAARAGYRQVLPSRRPYHNVTIDALPVAGLTFLNTGKARVTGTVFSDANANGVRDRIEGGLSFRTVFVDANDNGVLDRGEAFTLSDRRGNFELTGLSPGTHVVRTLRPRGYSQTGPAGAAYTVTLSGGQVAGGRHFGLRPRG